MRTYLVRIPHRKGPSIHRAVLPTPGQCGPGPPHPRSEPSWPQREGSQVARGQLRSNNRAEACFRMTPLCFVRCGGRLVVATLPLTWVEGRAPPFLPTRLVLPCRRPCPREVPAFG